MKQIYLFISILYGSFLPQIACGSSSVVLGILEHTKEDYVGAPFFHTVRVLFKKSGDEWISFKNECSTVECLKTITKEFPAEVHWTIAFDGKNIGSLTSKSPTKFKYYSNIGFQDIDSNQKVPTIGKPTKDFHFWNGYEVYRPLAAVSSPNYEDPDRWEQAEATMSSALYSDFSNLYPSCECSEYDDSEPKCAPMKYDNKQIKLKKSYSSNKRWNIVVLKLDCPKQFNSVEATYAITPDGKPMHLGKGLILIDEGDYDRDGKSEVVFKSGGYNQDGYTLFYNNFSKNVEFIWHYH